MASPVKQFLQNIQARNSRLDDPLIDNLIEEISQKMASSRPRLYDRDLAEYRLRDRMNRLEPYKTHLRMLTTELHRQEIFLSKEKDQLRRRQNPESHHHSTIQTELENERINLTCTDYATNDAIDSKLGEVFEMLDSISDKLGSLHELLELCEEIGSETDLPVSNSSSP